VSEFLPALAKGLVIGFSIAAPVGPIGLLTIQRTLERGTLAGLVTGLGAAAADTVYGAIAGFGLAAISQLLAAWDRGIRLVGGALMLWLAWSIARQKLADQAATTREGGGLLGAFASTFLLTLANPATILSFLGIFAGLGVGAGGDDTTTALALVLGVFLGSAAWWLILAGGVGAVRRQIGHGARRAINLASAAILAGLAAWALAGLI
jgi:threonine/homoserine/homoserine lactone efflux protein